MSGNGSGTGTPAWAAGLSASDLWLDFVNNRGQDNGVWTTPAAKITDTHAQSINAPATTGVYSAFAANVLTRTDLGMQTVPTAAQLLTSPRDFTDAAWVAVTCTKAFTATGIDGVANSASTLTASGAAATVLQTVVSAAVSRTFSVFVKRRTGTGTISISQDGVAWTDVTAQINASTYTRVTLTATQLNPVVGFQITTSGDAIDVDVGQLQTGAFATSPIYTTTTVNGNQQVIDLTGRLGTGVAGLVQFNQLVVPSGYAAKILQFNDGSATNRFRISIEGGQYYLGVTSAGASLGNINITPFVAAGVGIKTIAFACSNSYAMARLVNTSAPSSIAPAGFPAGMNSAGLGGDGYSVSNHNYQFTRKLALSFGPQDQTSFDAMYQRAVLAAS